jgi:hypothetical protein
MSVVYLIRDWDRHFEKAQSRKVSGPLDWVALPTKHDGKSYRRIMMLDDAHEVYGAWVLIVQVAAKCPVRGLLADEDGPLDASDLALKTGGNQSVFDKALTILASRQIGWLVVAEWESVRSALPPQERTGEDRTRQERRGEDTSCVETGQPSSTPAKAIAPGVEPAVLEFPCDGNPSAWRLTASQAAEWQRLFPSLDIVSECRAALAWVLADSSHRKTARGMLKFLVGWFGRSQDRGRGRANGSAARQRPHAVKGIGDDNG